MDFSLSLEQLQLRERLREWLREVLPPDWRGSGSSLVDRDWEFADRFNRLLGARGWMAPGWPVEWGGMGLDAVSELLRDETLSYHYAPIGNRFQGVKHIGPLILRYGTEEQRGAHLPSIVDGSVTWAQGYSEPGAGSDLASLTTRAERDGDDYVLNGAKIWTTNALVARWIFILARTDPAAPRHRGISLFLAPMDAPGMTVRPIENLAGAADFCEVRFDNLRIPRTGLLGEENAGWYMAVELLDRERAIAGDTGLLRRQLDDLRPFLPPRPDGRSGVARYRYVELTIELATARLLGYMVAWRADRGEDYSTASSVVKLVNSGLSQRIAHFGVELFGLRGLLREDSRWAAGDGLMAKRLLWSIMETIGGGTSEVQRNIIAVRGLGLPRS